MDLTKIFDGGFEHSDIVVSGDVAVQPAAPALRVTHFAEHASVRRSDPLDSVEGAGGVEMHVLADLARKIHILRGDLTVLGQAADQVFLSQEMPFAVRDGRDLSRIRLRPRTRWATSPLRSGYMPSP